MSCFMPVNCNLIFHPWVCQCTMKMYCRDGPIPLFADMLISTCGDMPICTDTDTAGKSSYFGDSQQEKK